MDGQDISELNVQEYRKNIALVSQEPVTPVDVSHTSVVCLRSVNLDLICWNNPLQCTAWCNKRC